MYKYLFLCFILCILLFSGCSDSESDGEENPHESNPPPVIGISRPDLVVSALTVTSWTTGTIAYSYTITNNGNAPANLDGPTDAEYDNVSVQAYLSEDTVFDPDTDIPAGGTIVGISPLGELAGGKSKTGSFSATAEVDPDATPYLVLMVDWEDVVSEADESNNTLAVEIPQPDLIVSALTVTSWTTGSIQYSYTITNNGNAPVNLDGPTNAAYDDVSVQAMLSTDTVFDNAGDIPAGGTFVGVSPLGLLEPGETLSGSFGSSVAVDPDATPYLVLKVDWGEVVDESDEDNNTLAAEIPLPEMPDLVVSSLTVDSWTTDSIMYSYTITNVGDAACMDGPTGAAGDNVSLQAVLSADTVFNNAGDIAAGGLVVNSVPVGGLEPGDSISGSFNSNVTVDPEETPYLVLMVDWTGVVDESNEDNNTLAAGLGIPDLVVSDLTVTAWTVNTIEYEYTITNMGDGPANLDGPTDSRGDNLSVQAILSADTVFDNGGDIAAGGTIVGMTDLGDLAPGASVTESFGSSVSLDPAVTPYLVLKVDWGGVVAESNEDNNTLAAEITANGLPDLVVTSLKIISLSSTAIDYAYTITNIGDAPANLDGPTGSEADNVSIQAVFSADTVFNNKGDIPAGGSVIGCSPLGNLDPGESFSGSFGAFIKEKVTPVNYLILMVDWGEDVYESDETNNTYTYSLKLAPK